MAYPAVIATWEFNGIVFTEYLFENVGDEIPLHDHPFNHTTKCTRGKVECFTEAGKSVTRDADDMTQRSPVIYKAGLWHGIRALTAGAIIINDAPIGAK